MDLSIVIDYYRLWTLLIALLRLRGRRSKGKGKGISGRDRARGRREEGGGEPFLSPLRAQIPLPLPLVTPATQAMCSANNGLCQC